MKKLRVGIIDGVLIALVMVLIAISYLSYRRINAMIEASNLVNHSTLIKLELEEVLTYMKDAETGQRGYLLTRDSGFLQPYYGAYEKVDDKLSHLRKLVSDNPNQLSNLDYLTHLTQTRFRKLDQVLKLPTKDAATLLPWLEDGKSLMDSIRAEVAKMLAVEDELLVKRDIQNNKYRSLAPNISLILSALSLLIIILAFLKIRSDQYHLLERDKMLIAKNLQLEQSNTELSSFSYVASHDLQEPLRKIQSFTKLIADRETNNLSDTGKDYFRRINAAAMRMQHLIESLLSFSRINIAEAVFVKTDLNLVLNEVQEVLKEQILLKHAVIESDLLPSIDAIPVQMHQLFLNILSNALKYSRKDAPPQIRITAEKVNARDYPSDISENGSYWKIVISDNGIGFEQVYAQKIFEFFQRLHSKSDYEGTGIGLAICKKIIQTHMGSISASGIPGTGATFTFFLPENNKA